jgi:outer membrane protein TolC
MKSSHSVVTAILGGLLLSILCEARAVTLEQVLQTTLEKNPDIQKAKLNLEQATGQRLVLQSIAWPNLEAGVPTGIQGGQRAGKNSLLAFAFARALFAQPLFNAAIPASFRSGTIGVLIAQQQLNVTVVEQLHAARLAFYAALYNRRLQKILEEQQRRLDENVVTQQGRYEAGLTDRSDVTSATVEAHELDSQIESARRSYGAARLELAGAMASDLGPDSTLPSPEGELQSAPVTLDVNAETAAAIRRRTDIQLARLMVRAAGEDQRIIEARYYPLATGTVSGDYLPVTGIHRQGSTSRNQDFISSEVVEGAQYTWQVIDNGLVTGAVIKQRKVREINELTCRKLEANVGRELLQIRNDLEATQKRQRSLGAALVAAEENAASVQQNLEAGVLSELEHRVAETGLLKIKNGLLNASYEHNVLIAEWDRATGRYFQFSSDTPQNVH